MTEPRIPDVLRRLCAVSRPTEPQLRGAALLRWYLDVGVSTAYENGCGDSTASLKARPLILGSIYGLFM